MMQLIWHGYHLKFMIPDNSKAPTDMGFERQTPTVAEYPV